MPEKCLSLEQQKELKRLYREEKTSMDQLAKRFHISKGTVVNTIHNYPYTTSPEDYRDREYRNMRNMLSLVVEMLQDEAKEVQGDILLLSAVKKREMFILSLAGDDSTVMMERVKKERLISEKRAWEALNRDDYYTFAHHAKLWAHLNDIAGDQKKNPFLEIREKTSPRNKACSPRFSGIDKYMTDMPTINSKNMKESQGSTDYLISSALWNEIRHIAEKRRRNSSVRATDVRSILAGLLYAMGTGCSLMKIPKQYGDKTEFNQYWQYWWFRGLFQLLWEIYPKWPELQVVSRSLANIEKHRIAFPGKLPKFSDIISR